MSKKKFFISASVFIGFFILFGAWLFLKNANNTHIYTPEEQKKINSETTPDTVEFIYTEQEQRDLLKWKNKSMDELVADAMNGDKAALHNLGEYFFLGLDFPIDVQKANIFFSKSASLGFAPALDQIAKMYINDESNAFLNLVYTNLTISFGHTEFIQTYHSFRNLIIKDFGKEVMMEIERIAAKKMLLIYNNQKGLKEAVNKKEFLSSMKKITDEDSKYNHDYWLKLYKKNKNEKTLWYLQIDSLDLNEATKEFLRLTVRGFLEVPKMLHGQISDFDIQNYLENNVPELMETKAGQYKICNDLQALASIPLIQEEAMNAILQENHSKSVDDLESQVNKRTKPKIDKILIDFKSRIKYQTV